MRFLTAPNPGLPPALKEAEIISPMLSIFGILVVIVGIFSVTLFLRGNRSTGMILLVGILVAGTVVALGVSGGAVEIPRSFVDSITN